MGWWSQPCVTAVSAGYLFPIHWPLIPLIPYPRQYRHKTNKFRSAKTPSDDLLFSTSRYQINSWHNSLITNGKKAQGHCMAFGYAYHSRHLFMGRPLEGASTIRKALLMAGRALP